MKKNKRLIVVALIACLLVALSIGGIVLLTGNSEEPAPAPVANWDIDWYNPDEKEFLITTMEELYGLAELSETYDFKGQTIKLGADIVVNEGDATQWADKAPEYLWNPIVGFAGKFDGQGHTISGVYGNSIVTSLGLFTDTQKSCVIKNLNLVNSCFKNNNDMGTGSIIGVGGGKLENIYSDALMVSSGKNIGGLIGYVNAKGENQITNCWFDGKITMDGYDCSGVGGLVGVFAVEDAINAISHCLSTADIHCMGENVGGVCGYVGNGAFLNLNDSMFTGTLAYDHNKYAVVGSMVGQVMGSASIIVNDAYTVDEIANRTIGTSDGYQKGNAIALNKNYLLGKAGYQWTTLDFENHWVAQKDTMPRLGYFTQATESIEGVQKMVDISWYDPAGATFEISNVQQLYGFAYLSRSYDFRGQTMKLVADITVNEGDASDWGKKAPAYNWTPIAWYGSSLSQRFKGTFDGQGHTISGIYAKGTQNITCIGLFGEIYHGAVVKDFKLVNSYFEGVQDSSIRGPVGSVSGRLRGTIENVYSDAIVVNSSKNTGGIVGMITGSGQNKISGCWFDGKLTGITRSGGILGGVYGNKGNIEATIEHCLNTGEMNIQIGQAGVGGICGTAETWSILYVDDCLNAGTYRTFGTGKSASKHIGTLVGTVTKTDGVGSKAVVTHSYGVKEFYERLVGWKHGNEGVDWNSMMYVAADELVGYNGYKWTSLDFKDHWAVRSNACPVPVAFATKKLSTSGVTRMVDYSWYDPDRSVNTVRTFQQLYGMARLWEVTNLFKGKTVLLGADITMNKGSASDWAEKAPAYVWEPAKFNGTFNGQGHTISGIYVKGGKEDNYIGFFHRIYKDGTVKNLKIKNSYFEGTMDSSKRGAVGSLAGRSNGIIDTVYSDAIVVNSAQMTGGLVGMITGEGKNVIRNSWFDGQISAVTRTGGILGGMYGNKQNIQVTLENCTNTADIAVQIGYGDVGGICGMAETGGKLIISDCLNAGTYKTVGTDKEANSHIGTVFGSVTEKNGVASHVVLDNVYGVSDFYPKIVGWKYGAEGVSSAAAVLLDMETLTAEGGYRYAQLDYTKEFALNADGIPVPKAFGVKTVAASDLLDYSWFDSDKSEYILTTAAQLEAFNVLCNGQYNYFADKTVKLGADITLNEGKAADWAAAAPEKIWTPITFSGVFDGQGHTVSGVYVKSEAQYNGFFHTLNSGASVKNFKLENSYIEGAYTGTETRAGVGSIAGRNYGTIDTVYSNAVVVNGKLMTGGIAGMSFGGTITNCWFDGQIMALGSTGGILGGTYAAEATVEHCLNTGSITVETKGANLTAIGGLCGYAQNTGGITILDSLNAGTVTLNAKDGNTIKQVGAVIGAIHAKATATKLNDAYGIQEFSANVMGYGSVAAGSADYKVVGKDTIKGYGAYQWTSLDFEAKPYWVLKKDAVPALAAFDTGDLSLEEVKKQPDYSWYDENATQYTITTAQQLLAFNELCDGDTDYFKGKTVKLGADITLTGGSKTTPNWTPINISGVFDGQGHTVSGIYVKSGAQYNGFFNAVNSGATVKNFKLKNSYIEGAYSGIETRAGVGSIAGRNYGTIDTVYSNAVVVNGKLMTGGIAGMSFGGTITNCWFDGQIMALGSTGGILGGTYAAEATVEHCLNTGSITVETKGANLTAIGGLCGYAQNTGGITILDSLNAGTVTLNAKDGNTIKQVGAVIGAIHAKATATKLNDAYGIKAFSASVIGYGSVAAGSANYKVVGKDTIKGADAYHAMTLDFEVKPYWVLMDGDIPGLAAFGEGTLDVADAKSKPDTSWYDANSDTYTINTTAQIRGYAKLLDEGVDFSKKTIILGADRYELGSGEQLRAFAAVCEKNNFAGKTVALTANINLGGADTPWTPVSFGGTFDGQGRTISDLTVSLFTKLDGATVKNLKLTNSVAAEVTNSTISNCVLTNADAYILGTAGNGTKLEHCYSNGGLIADVQGTTEVKDSLAAGTPVNTAADGKLTMTDVYGIGDANESITVGGAAYTIRKLDDIKGYGAYQWTALDFDSGTWVLKADAVPGLNVFEDTDLDMAYAKTLPDYSWYSETAAGYVLSTARQLHGYMLLKDTVAEKTVTLGASEYTITTADQLLAFNALSAQVDYFAGKTVKLGCNIALTGGSAAKSNWTPVSIKGTFDGQGHSISGAYVSAGSTYVGFFHTVYSGGTVKNLKLTDSVIKNTKTSGNSGTGSIAGRCLGTVDTVYSNATVTNGSAMTGGIVGMIVAIDGATDGAKKITNCWFDGVINGNNASGGILGGSYGMTATIEHCLNTGTMNIGAGKKQIGGLIGYVQGAANVTLSDSLNAGTLVTTSTSQIGTIVGAAAKNALTVGNVYGATDTGFGTKKYGWTGSTPVVLANTDEVAGVLESFFGTGAAKLDFTAWWTAREGKIPVLKRFS